ncbi:hypothetical protein [Actinosynnema sp. NPDC020468]|uniref:hypothetical protein n=1 Tax=Actinosynnema sp. NPDC020468 TaxID=3154488 RepID=UPI0033E4B9D2
MSVADLVERMTPMLPDPVDELQVAALLESQGVTDQAAVDEYGMADVFALAHEVYGKLPSSPGPTPEAGPRGRTWHDVLHGPVYLLPTTVYPAVFAVLGAADAAVAMVLATTAGWIWGAGTSWVAHQLVGVGAARSGGRRLLRLGWYGIAVAASVALPVLFLPHGFGQYLFVLGQLGVQLASGVLLFHRKELWLVLSVVPAGVAGLTHLASGYSEVLVPTVLACGGATVVLALELARRAGRDARDREGVRVPTPRNLALGAAPSVLYAALCAGFLLYTDVRYVLGALDLAVAAAPLILGMGVVEWRANRLFERAEDLLGGDLLPTEFAELAWRNLLRELANCLVALGALGLVVLGLLRWFGVLTTRGALLLDAHVLLGGAFFLGFVLIRTGGLVTCLAILSGVLLADVVVAELAADALAPQGHAVVFLPTVALLSVLLLTALRRSVGQVRHYR